MNNDRQHNSNAELPNSHDVPTRETITGDAKSDVHEHVSVEPVLEPEGIDQMPSGLFDMDSIDVMQDTIGDSFVAAPISLNAPSSSQTKPEPATIDTLPGHNTGYIKGARNPINSYWVWLLTFLTFEWVTPLIFRGFRKPLELHNLWELLKVDTAEVLGAKFSKIWRRRQQRKAGLLSSLTKMIGPRFFGAGVLLLFSNICSLVTPYFLSFILQYINRGVPQADDYKGYLWVLGLFLTQCLSQILQSQHFYQTSLVAMRTRTVLLSEVYQKSLLLSTRARQEKGSGEIVNLMSLDSQKVGESLLYLHFAWSGIFMIVVSIILLYTLIGWPTFVGLAVMLLILPIQAVVMVLYTRYRKRSLIFSDERIRVINEVINGIKIIKFFTWEESFKERITEVRKNEVTQLFKQSVVRAVIGAVMMGGPVLCSTLTFITFYLYYGYASLTADVVFPAISYFNLMRFPLTMFPMIIGFAVEALISIKRLQDFFGLEEKEATGPPVPTELQNTSASSSDGSNDAAIEVTNASFIWENPLKKSKSNSRKERRKRIKQAKANEKGAKVPSHPVPLLKKPFILENIDLSIKKGQLIMIVGAVGSGKSSLVQALLGEMPVLAGSTKLRGSVAYCPQQAWVQNATIRDNISFGKPFDEARYNLVLDVCNLRQDLLVLPGGDFSEIGEKGINLSGGQRHRVQLARATYNDADIVILDDPLSALDAHVGRAIFEQNICGFMKGKTRVLVTHQLQYLNRADEILVIDQGELVERGTFAELAMRENGVLARLIHEYSVEQQHEEEEVKVKESKPAAVTEAVQPTSAPVPPTNNEQQGKLISAEERAVGGLSFKTIWKYLGYMGGPFVGIFLVLLFMVAQAAIVAADAWLSQWISRRYAYLDRDGTPIQMYIYLALGLASPIFAFFRDLSFLLSALLAAYRMHRHLLTRVLKAPMAFFDTTPLGRILSRFAKDQENVDTVLIVILNQFFTAMMQVLSCVAIIAYAVPWFLIALLPILAVYIAVQQLYRRTSREVKKLDGLSRSPLYAHFSESLSGINTIRSYGRSQEFIQMNRRLVDLNQRAYFAIFATQRWLTFRLDLVGSFIVLAAGILMMATRTSLNAGVAGLAFSYALQVTQFLSYAVRQATDAEAQMNSVERILYYSTEIPNEKPSHIPNNTPPQTWPDAGKVEFKDYEMRYRPELQPVLKDINLLIRPGEKIGVIGRSGAGKSSLMLAIFRIVEASKGAIVIDNVDINNIGLTDLRSRLSIIPQEPVIFSGTVRSNIDPFSQYSEEHLWNVLEKAHLKDAIVHLPQQLDSPVVEGGENFSVGQRQLLCLARALTKDSKILILDEATANVDMETDALIQRTIRDAFAQCTRLTIAHRLNTILDSDRILVMDKGTPAEFDTPMNLLMNERSIFVSLVNETGEANAQYIRKTIIENANEPSLQDLQQQASSSTS